MAFRTDVTTSKIIESITLPDWYSDEVRRQRGRNVIEFFQSKITKLDRLEIISANIPFGGGINPAASSAGRKKNR